MGQAAPSLGFLRKVVFKPGNAIPLVALSLTLYRVPLLFDDVYGNLWHHRRNQVLNSDTEFHRVSKTLANKKEL